MFFFPCI